MKKKGELPPPVLLLVGGLLLTSFLRPCHSAEGVVGLNDDVLGLVVFKTGLSDPTGALSTWSEDDDTPCTAAWRFILCDPSTGRVSGVALDGLGLSGRLSPLGLEKLTGLRSLSLSGNDLSGPVPAGLSLLPSLGRLDLSRNRLSGPIPDSLFSEGPLCDALTHLDLSGNDLEGQVPPSLSRCRLLQELKLSDNRLTGANLAGTVYKLTNLRTLDLSRNAFSGQVPADGVSSLRYLSELRLAGNAFEGPVPATLALCPHLTVLDLSSNSLSGEIPGTLRHLASLACLNLSRNPLSGRFPSWVTELGSLRVLDLSGVQLPGSTIPPELFQLGLEELDLSSVGLVGAIPAGSTRLFETLQRLDLSGNALSGEIPPEVALFYNLRQLNLSGNPMNSRIPAELGYIRNLTVLDLSSAELRGPIPGGLCDSGCIEVLRLGGNTLTGPVPDDIGNCSSLQLLNLSHDNLTGSIPSSISKLPNLRFLNLEYNEIAGEIPPELVTLDGLVAVNLSHNRLVGRLPPSRAFQTLDPSALEGNQGLCSPLVSQPCVLDVPKPLVLDPNSYNPSGNSPSAAGARVPSARNRHFLGVSVIAAISATALLALGILVVALLNASVRRRLGHVQNVLESACSMSTSSKHAPVGPLVTFDVAWRPPGIASGAEAEALLGKATELGSSGAFGRVYKVPLSSGGGGGCGGNHLVAVRRLLASNIVRCHVEFEREVRNLGSARHPNLMPLKGYYWTPQLQLLITDYAAHGGLDAHLHPADPDAPGRLRLSWADRFGVALGTAEALAHLHHAVRPPVVHYNLKPSNILLDEGMRPRVSDFGLARLLPKLERRVAMSRLGLGYVAPELACRSLRVSEKCDVYAFGVVVLELVTGRRAVQCNGDGVALLVEEVREAVGVGRWPEMVDGEMMGEWEEGEVMPVLKLGLVCASQVPSSRPSMMEVVEILRVIRPTAAAAATVEGL